MKKTTLIFITLALVVFTLPAMAQLPAYVPASGLSGWWPFTGNANDLSANANNGNVTGAALTLDRNNNSNCAYYFNGTSDYISCIISSLPTGSAPRSISSWIQTTSGPIPTNIDPTVITITAYGVSSSGAVIFGQFVRTSVGTGYFESGSSQNEIYSGTTINDGIWHHIVMTYGGPGTSVKMYIDGVEEVSTAPLTLATGNSFFGIGKSPWANTFFQGKIDDVGLWNRALTENEITDLYHACSPATATSSPNQTVTIGNSTQITVASSVAVSVWQWQTDIGFGYQNVSNAAQYSGATTATLNISNVTSSNNNQMFRCILTSNVCTYTSTPTILTVAAQVTGIDVSSAKRLIMAHPNPASNNITITVDANLLGLDYMVYNQLGEVVLKGELKSEKQLITMCDLSPGVYFAVIGGSKEVIKILKSSE